MPITVAMIEEKEFKTKMRGYDPVEVDEFLDDICDEMVALQEEIATLNQRLNQAAHNSAYMPSAVPAPVPMPAPAPVPAPVVEKEAPKAANFEERQFQGRPRGGGFGRRAGGASKRSGYAESRRQGLPGKVFAPAPGSAACVKGGNGPV